MNSPKQEVGTPGYTDSIDERLDKVAHLLAVQQTKARSKRMLLSLFQAFSRVHRERDDYVAQVHNQTATLAWADGYLHATADAINFYLEKRFSVAALTFEECELIVERPSLTELFEHATGIAAAINPHQTPKTDAARGNALPNSKTGPRDGPDPRSGVRPLGNLQPPGTGVPG